MKKLTTFLRCLVAKVENRVRSWILLRNLRRWQKLLARCEKLASKVLLALWETEKKNLDLQQETKTWEDLSLSLPAARNLLQQIEEMMKTRVR